MIVNRPPMGWNSWNTFGENINEDMIKEMADAMVEGGYLDAGYEYLVIDDCWAELHRDEKGNLVPSKEKFPNGMKALADYVHSKGLKFGMYSCVGFLTCAGYPGSYDHEFQDAATFAEWGVDFLKYDFCYRAITVKQKMLYRRMGLALEGCGRDILFSACSWGRDETEKWIQSTGAAMWRKTGDINDRWGTFHYLADKVMDNITSCSRGCFGDLDMLTVGMNGKGNVGQGGMTFNEYKMHFTLWAQMNSPLMIGCDIREADEETRKILLNKDVIAINQDPLTAMPYNIEHYGGWNNEGVKIYVKHLSGGDLAIGIYNFSEEEAPCIVTLDLIGLPPSTGKTLRVKELWTGTEKTVANGVLRTPVGAHDCKIYRCKVIDI